MKNYIDIPYSIRKNCAVCGEKLSKPVIELPQLPLTEIYVKKKPPKDMGLMDQYFHYCVNCGHGQLKRVVSPKIIYSPSAYFFKTSQSATSKISNDFFLNFIQKQLRDRPLDILIEVGCSDLYLLNKLKKDIKKAIGIDPILKGREKELSKGKTTVIGDYWENIDLPGLISNKQTLVICSHTLEHIVDPKRFITSLIEEASQDALFIFQFPSLEILVANGRYDQIFHQHLHYFSLVSFAFLLQQVGGEIVAYQYNYQHWGSLLVAFRKSPQKNRKKILWTNRLQIDRISKITEGYTQFQQMMRSVNNHLQVMAGQVLYGYGAALMLPVLSYHLRNNFSSFKAILDDDPQKNNLYYINLPVPILNPIPDIEWGKINIVVTALDNARSILPKALMLKPRRIILPINVI